MGKKSFKIVLVLIFSLVLISLSFVLRQTGAIRGTVTDTKEIVNFFI